MTPKPSPVSGPDDPDDKLDSWKAIASFLGRDVRTVQRWERTEGLPVHRHQHGQLGSVYAFRSELNAWQASRRRTDAGVTEDKLPAAPLPPGAFTRHHPPLGRSVLIGAAVVLVSACLLALRTRNGVSTAPAAPATPPVPLTLALSDVVAPLGLDTPGDPLVRVAATAEWVRLGGQTLDPSVVSATLTEMRRGNSALTFDVTRAMAIRRGGVHLVGGLFVSGEGSRAALTLVVWTGPEATNEVGRWTIEHRAGGDVADEGRELARQLMTDLPRIRALARPTRGLPRVTTVDLRALHRYSDADRLMRDLQWMSAIPMLQNAIAADPDFASAYIHLAWTLSHLGRPSREWEPLIDRALALREHVSELEHCFITGSAQMMRGHAAESAPAWERVLAIDPRHYWALGNLAHALYAQGDHDRADAVQIQRARLHGDNLVSQIVATDLLMNAGDQRGAQAVAERVPALLTSATLEERWIADVWLAFWEACGAFAAHESVQLRALADRAAASIRDADHASPGDASAHGYGTGSYYQAGLVYLSLGMVSRAELMFALPANDAERYQYLALATHLRGDDVKARLYLRQMAAGGFARAMPFAGVLFVDVGLVQDAERLVKVWERGRWWPDPFIAPARARILLARGRRIEALETVNKALPVLEKGWGEPWVATVTTASTQVLQALRLKARMLRDNGQLGAAIEVLETAEAHTPLLCSAQRFAGVEWLGLRADLLDLYRQGHRVQAAAALAHELQDALSQADTKDVFGWLALSPELTAALRTGDK